MRPTLRRLLLLWIGLVLLTACAPTPENTPQAQLLPPTLTLPPPEITSEVTSATGVPAQPTEPTPITLRIWMPEPLAPVDNEDGAEILSEQISAFLAVNGDIQIELRLKRANEVGGVLSTLRSANAVALNALPDITLLRRADLVAAVEGGYLEAMQDRAPALLTDDLFSMAAGLGRVDGRLYGVPYALDLWHTAFDPARVTLDNFTLESWLNTEVAWLFPANRPSGINETLLAQIIAGGGVFDAEGDLRIDEGTLRAIFAFYQTSMRANTLSPDILNYNDPIAYRDQLVTGEISLAVVNSRLYRELGADAFLQFGALPTTTGNPSTVIDGWMWVMVTADTQRQEAAFRFLTWMFDSARQSQYTSAIHYVPSQHSAIGLWDDQAYATFVQTQIDAAVYPLTGSAAVTARILQNSLLEVLNGTRTAEQAARDVFSQIGG